LQESYDRGIVGRLDELPASWYSREERSWWRRLTLERIIDSKPAHILFYAVAVPWFLLEAALAIVLTGGAVWGFYLAVTEAPIFLLLFPPLWFLAFWLLAKLWSDVIPWLVLDLRTEVAFWWNEWRVHRGSRVRGL
jgi:hypothetical protein